MQKSQAVGGTRENRQEVDLQEQQEKCTCKTMQILQKLVISHDLPFLGEDIEGIVKRIIRTEVNKNLLLPPKTLQVLYLQM